MFDVDCFTTSFPYLLSILSSPFLLRVTQREELSRTETLTIYCGKMVHLRHTVRFPTFPLSLDRNKSEIKVTYSLNILELGAKL